MPEDKERKIQKSLIQTNIKNILLAVTAINSYGLKITLVSFLNHTYNSSNAGSVTMIMVTMKSKRSLSCY